jgi:hypothetical protein
VAATPAAIAAAERWLARVWPALALGGTAGVDSSLGAAAPEALLRPAAAVVARLLTLVSAVSKAESDPSLAGPSLAERANDPKPAVADPSSATDPMKVVYLVTLIGLLGLLTFTIVKELGPVLRASWH